MSKLYRTMLVGLVALMALPAFAALNVNTATQSELEGVKGLGPEKAKAIIAYRETNGNFKHLEDLDKVKGFGKASIDKLRGELTVGPENTKKQ
jgi:competence protein ComEA